MVEKAFKQMHTLKSLKQNRKTTTTKKKKKKKEKEKKEEIFISQVQLP